MSTNNNTGSYNIGSYNSGSEFLVIVEIALQLAFEAGKWEGVRKSAKEYVEKALAMVVTHYR